MDLIRDALCEEIIESAKRITREKSASKLTVRDILKDMNITNRVFYNRFHGIEEVLNILYGRSVSEVRQSLTIPWDGESDYEAHIRAVAARTLELTYESRENLSQYIFETDSIRSENLQWWQQEIKKLIHTGKELHVLRGDLEEESAAYSIWCFIRGFAADAMARKLPKDTAFQRFDYGFDCLLRGLKA